jgi:ATP-dependent Clp protease ATP-binding subunit ClpA
VELAAKSVLALRTGFRHNRGGELGVLKRICDMASPEDSLEDIFLPGGRLRPDLLTEGAAAAMKEALRLARETRWDSVRSPHVFMGLLASPDASVRNWGERLQADLSKLLDQFQELFHQEEGEEEALLVMNREFLSDNVIHLLRDAFNRAIDHHRRQITPMDLLISLLTMSNSIVAQCFERIGVTAAKLTELAVIAEHTGNGK